MNAARLWLACAGVGACLAVPAHATAQHQHHPPPPAPARPASPAPPSPAQAGHDAHEDHAAHEANEDHARDAASPVTPIPAVTDADRAAAFPDVAGHAVHDRTLHSFVLVDQLEWSGGADGSGGWDNTSWVGGDVHRLWVRTEGEVEHRTLESADLHVLYGRPFSSWWDVVGGLRQDFGPGPNRTWAAFGVQGLAPYLFEVQATAYVGAGGRTHARLEAEYELLLTNRLVLQPLVELELYGKADPERRIGAGLSTLETGLRLRYELRREFAPYVGLAWERRFGRTADYAGQDGDDIDNLRLLTGVRVWF